MLLENTRKQLVFILNILNLNMFYWQKLYQRILLNIYDGAFSENILRLLAAGSFCKKINHRCLTGPGHILDLYCVRLSNAVHSCENYAKIMRKLSFFHRRLPFLANIERCPKFLEHALRALNAPLILFCFCITL